MALGGRFGLNGRDRLLDGDAGAVSEKLVSAMTHCSGIPALRRPAKRVVSYAALTAGHSEIFDAF